MKMKLLKFDDRWKWLFFGLLTLNIIVFIVMLGFILWPVSEAEIPPVTKPQPHESSEFVVRTTKQNLNDLINAYLDKFLEHTQHDYSVSLEEDVHLFGELPVFSSTVPLSIHLEPIVQDNGNIILKQKSISLGLLELPNQKIMEYMKKYLPMPEWVIINPKKEEIYVAVTEMKIKSNFQVGIEQFDLKTNHLAFRIHVPYKTLGIEAPIEE